MSESPTLKKLTVSLSLAPLVLAMGAVLSSTAVFSQEIDETQTLPDARPGECYAKVITPAKFTTETEEVVIQEASERVETIAAVYERSDQTMIIKEAGTEITVEPAEYGEDFEKVVVRPAELNWTSKTANELMPASPGALEGILQSGVDLDRVEPGSCFREYYTEPEYQMEELNILTKEGSQRIEITAAVYKNVQERVVVKEASTQVVDVPAVYRTETESVLVEPARSVWKVGRGPVERIDNTTGEIMCLIEVPARYETITKTVLDKPATTKTISIPAEYKTVAVQKLVKPASERRSDIEPEYTKVKKRVKVADAGFFWLSKGEDADADARFSGQEVCLTGRQAETTTIKKQIVKVAADMSTTEVPAEYETIEVQRLKSAATERRIPIPARTRTVTSQIQIAPSKLEWRPVLCETNMTTEIITSLQKALAREGFDPGPIDGVVGQGTMIAIEKFQNERDLDRGGITYQSLKALKVQS